MGARQIAQAGRGFGSGSEIGDFDPLEGLGLEEPASRNADETRRMFPVNIPRPRELDARDVP